MIGLKIGNRDAAAGLAAAERAAACRRLS